VTSKRTLAMYFDRTIAIFIRLLSSERLAVCCSSYLNPWFDLKDELG